ncbi:Adenylosuccinate lyase [Camellia lanceoleosa]|uniref:Adenylosuccinate lyase n=1 Tax=Camellia lanceoleosa TaxID=1840588 RepID=A0ACC0IC22_9ERIC|nr:Adenylosuccinate lyase [Camellia lanceoleosa]
MASSDGVKEPHSFVFDSVGFPSAALIPVAKEHEIAYDVGSHALVPRIENNNSFCGLTQLWFAYRSALQGISKLQVNEASLFEDLNESWEVLAKPIQTVMRRYGIPEPYEKLKELTEEEAITGKA